MAKANQNVTWSTNSNVAPGARKESDVMTMDAASFEASGDLSITAVSGSETGYRISFYVQSRNDITGAFESLPPTSRMSFLGSIIVDTTTVPLQAKPAWPFPHLPTEYKIIVISDAVTDTATLAVNVRTNSP